VLTPLLIARGLTRPSPSPALPMTPKDLSALDQDDLRRERDQHRRNLQRYQLQESYFGPGFVPVHILNLIDWEKAEIRRIEEELARRGRPAAA
jgi:hypothetical protein